MHTLEGQWLVHLIDLVESHMTHESNLIWKYNDDPESTLRLFS